MGQLGTDNLSYEQDPSSRHRQ